MPRLSDMVRTGQEAFRQDEPQQESAQPGDAQKHSDQAEFRSLPHAQQPPSTKMGDFPVLSQIYNEVGTVATVVEQINQISTFIQAFTGEEGAPVLRPPMPRSPAAAPAEPSVAPPPQAQEAHSPRAQAQTQPPSAPSPQPPAPEAAQDEVPEEEIEALYDELYAFVEEVTQAAQDGLPFTMERAFQLIPRVVDTPNATDVLYRRAIYAREEQDEHGFASIVVLHSVNVAIYALKIAEGLGYNRAQSIDLGVASLVHDVGMVTLPIDLFAPNKGRFSQEDFELLQQHPLRGQDILLRLGEKYQWLADIAYQEQEREDGSGYPQGLRNGDIHEYARIIGVADVYAGLTRRRGDRRALLPFEAVKEIIQSMKQKFDPRVIRILLNKLSAFPIGSLVKLNSGAIGSVVETDENFPLRPTVKILYDAQGRQLSDDRVVNLREHPILHITDAVDEGTLGKK